MVFKIEWKKPDEFYNILKEGQKLKKKIQIIEAGTNKHIESKLHELADIVLVENGCIEIKLYKEDRVLCLKPWMDEELGKYFAFKNREDYFEVILRANNS